MDSSWNLAVSPYDVLGVAEEASDAQIKAAYRELAKLFHPDRNQLAERLDERTAHFVKIHKAYETLIDPSSRRLYDVCLASREKLVRKNCYKYAVSNTPEFRDIVDEQFKEAVLDPDSIATNALVLCCESCAAPSKFRCSICDMLTCTFCSLKQHAKDGIPPHYPSRYSPRFKRSMESDGRRMRLLKAQDEDDRSFMRRDKTIERRVFKREIKKETPKLAWCYGWCQSEGAVYLAVWIPGEVSEVDIVLRGGGLKIKHRSLESYVVDREFAGEVDVREDLECASFPATNIIVVKVIKRHYGEVWRCAFKDDSFLLRDAGDHNIHEWAVDLEEWDDLSPAFLVDVHVPRCCTKNDLSVELTPTSLRVTVKGYLVWSRHFTRECLFVQDGGSNWSLVEVDGRQTVRLHLYFAKLPLTKDDKGKKSVDVSKLGEVFIEDSDDLYTMAHAQLVAFLDHGATFMPESELRKDTLAILSAMRKDRPRSNRKDPLLPAFSDAEERNRKEQAPAHVVTKAASQGVRRWYTRSAIEEERAWMRKRGYLEGSTVVASSSQGDPGERASSAQQDELPAQDDGEAQQAAMPAPPVGAARGAPVRIDGFFPPAEQHHTEPAAVPISTFAWEGGDSETVRLYIDLASLVTALTPEMVSVQIESRKIRVQVQANPLLLFETSLFSSVAPSKCTLRVKPGKRMIIVDLRKKKQIAWASLSRDVNA